MSILIKGMEMPTRCGRCDMRIPAFDDGLFDHYECCITAAIIDNLGEKMEDCPLVPVPPHGALMDRDDFFATCPELVSGYKTITDELVVIPAEEGET